MENLIYGIVLVFICLIGYAFAFKFQHKDKYKIAILLLILSGLILRIYTASDFFLHASKEYYS